MFGGRTSTSASAACCYLAVFRRSSFFPIVGSLVLGYFFACIFLADDIRVLEEFVVDLFCFWTTFSRVLGLVLRVMLFCATWLAFSGLLDLSATLPLGSLFSEMRRLTMRI